MLMEIDTALLEAECMRMPICYIRPDVDKSISLRIKDIIANHQGEMTEDEEEATHIIYPPVDPSPDEFARPNFKRDKHVMVHWYYFPESYDSWLLNTFDLPENVPDSPPSPGERWRVSATWVLDLDQYNEWMAEEDYEVDDSGRKKMHKLRLAVDDLISGGSDEKKKVHQVAGAKAKRKRSPSPPLKGGKRKR